MKEEILHNFPSYAEETQAIAVAGFDNSPPRRTERPSPPPRVRRLYEMVDGRLPERQNSPSLHTSSARTTPQPASFIDKLRQVFMFVIGQC